MLRSYNLLTSRCALGQIPDSFNGSHDFLLMRTKIQDTDSNIEFSFNFCRIASKGSVPQHQLVGPNDPRTSGALSGSR